MFAIAGCSLDSPFILAPLAGYSDLPFRLLCREYGASLVVSEMISCHALIYKQEKTMKMLASCPADRPVAFQLFGADPDIIGEAAALLQEFQPDCIDLNMGCPVRKVTKRGAGSALMKDIKLAEKIITAVVNNSSVPVTVKTRIGIDSQTITAFKFAAMSADAGASAITIHGRTWAQGFSGTADWEIIRQIKERATIPVIGNGDIKSYDEGINRMRESTCDAVMVGRAALGNPWVFSAAGRPEGIDAILIAANRHLELIEKHLDTNRVLAYVRNQIGRYFRDFSGSSLIRQSIHSCNSFPVLKEYILSLASPDHNRHFN